MHGTRSHSSHKIALYVSKRHFCDSHHRAILEVAYLGQGLNLDFLWGLTEE